MSGLNQTLSWALTQPVVRRAARAFSDFVDLQWAVMLEQLAEVAPLAKGKLLDVGCGDKPYEHLFTPYVSSYLGIEKETTFADTNASRRGRGPDLTYAGDRLPFEDGTFDTVLNIQVLEHTPEPQALLDEMARVLKPDGLLILSVPFSFRLHEEPHDYFRYSPHGIRAMCERAGLRIENQRPQGGLWSVLGHKVNSYLAFRAGRFEGFANDLGKASHEDDSQRRSPRLWALPIVMPLMAAVSGSSRVLDRVLPDETEALSFLFLLRPGSP